MNNDRRKRISMNVEVLTKVEEYLKKVQSTLESVKEDIEGIKMEEEEYYDNMPEGFKNGDKGEAAQNAIKNGDKGEAAQNAINSLDNAFQNLEAICDALGNFDPEDIKEQLNAAAE